MTVHFVGFKNEHDSVWNNAVAVFGFPDFVHRHHDKRAVAEFDDDVVVFSGKETEDVVREFTYNDSQFV